MISIDKWAGLVTNASPYSIPPGAAVTQVNVQCLSPGQLTVRQGLQAYTFSSTVAATRPVISAFAFPHGQSPIVVYQDANGNVFSGSVVAGSGGSGFTGVPSAPRSVTATPYSASVTVSWDVPEFFGGGAGITGYSVQLSTDGGTTWTFAASATATSVSIAGLTNGQPYVFRAAATNTYGIGPFSAATSSVTPVGAPESPTTFTASAGSSSAVLSWAAPANNGGTAITDYRVEYKLLAASEWTVFADGTSTATTATVTGLTNGQQYVFRVAAVNAAGVSDYASYLTPVMPVGVPDQITTLTATYGNALVTLTWQAPASNNAAGLTDYILQSSTDNAVTWATISDGLSLDTTYVATQLTNGTSYRFRAAAVNAVGTGPYSSPTAAVIPRTLPGTPTGLTTTPGNAQAVLSWTAPSSNGGAEITDYRIQVSIAGGAYTTITRTASTATSFTVTSLTNGTSYTFRVAAVNSEGAGSYVTGTAVTPQTVPLAPTNVLTTTGDAQVLVRWTAPTDTGGSAITDYTLQYSSNSGSTWTAFPHTPTTATQLTVTGLTNGTAYIFRVAAVSAVGTGNFSASSDPATPLGVPSAPLNAFATGGNTQLFTSWEAPASDGGTPITGYVLQYRRTSATDWTTYGTVTGVLAYTISGVTNGFGYQFRVAAINAVGTGQYSAYYPATGGVYPGLTPLAPTNLTFSNAYANSLTDTTLTLSWTPGNAYGNRITDYIIQNSTNGSTWTTIADGTNTTATATLTGIDPTVSYYYRVAAVSTVGPGAYSATPVNPYRITNPPAAPTVTATIAPGVVTLTWPAVSDGNGAIIRARIVQNTQSSGTWYYGNPDSGLITNASVDLAARTAVLPACPQSGWDRYSYSVHLENVYAYSTRGVSNSFLPSQYADGPSTAPTFVSASHLHGVITATVEAPSQGCYGTLGVDYSNDAGATWTAATALSTTSAAPYPTSPSFRAAGNSVSFGPITSGPVRLRFRYNGRLSYIGDGYAASGDISMNPQTNDPLWGRVIYYYNGNTLTRIYRNSTGGYVTQSAGTASSTVAGRFGTVTASDISTLSTFGSGAWPLTGTTTTHWEWWQRTPVSGDPEGIVLWLYDMPVYGSTLTRDDYIAARITSTGSLAVEAYRYTYNTAAWTRKTIMTTTRAAAGEWAHILVTNSAGYVNGAVVEDNWYAGSWSTTSAPTVTAAIKGNWVESVRVTQDERYADRPFIPMAIQFPSA